MKKYKVKINEKVYEVEVEEMIGGAGEQREENTVEQNSKITAKPDTKSPGEAVKKKEPRENVEGEKILSPLPGNISVEVSTGDEVSEGDIIFVLEAMKMENEISAPVSGTLREIYVADGDAVETGDLLAVIG
ncbi:MAG: acetyl-CoA carboxylase biotin carboxyl carrier protein subunit [Halanaerobiales bacterium]